MSCVNRVQTLVGCEGKGTHTHTQYGTEYYLSRGSAWTCKVKCSYNTWSICNIAWRIYIFLYVHVYVSIPSKKYCASFHCLIFFVFCLFSTSSSMTAVSSLCDCSWCMLQLQTEIIFWQLGGISTFWFWNDKGTFLFWIKHPSERRHGALNLLSNEGQQYVWMFAFSWVSCRDFDLFSSSSVRSRDSSLSWPFSGNKWWTYQS